MEDGPILVRSRVVADVDNLPTRNALKQQNVEAFLYVTIVWKITTASIAMNATIKELMMIYKQKNESINGKRWNGKSKTENTH